MGNPPTGTDESLACHSNPQKVGDPAQLGIVLRLVEDRISIAQAIDPWREVAEAHPVFQGELPGQLPGVLPEKLPGRVSDVVDAVLVRLAVVGKIAGQQVGVLVSIAEGVADRNLENPFVLLFAGCAFRIHS